MELASPYGALRVTKREFIFRDPNGYGFALLFEEEPQEQAPSGELDAPSPRDAVGPEPVVGAD